MDSAGVVIAVDGPSGSGKSSVAQGVARTLRLRYLDTGAMYRAVTWWMLHHGVDVADPAAVAAHAHLPAVTVGTDPHSPWVRVDGLDVSRQIRGRAVTNAVSAVSAVPQVRSRLVALQRQVIGSGDIVVEGRDIGTVVAPQATVKVFLTATAETRAQRRAHQIDHAVPLPVTHAELTRRDHLDSTRAASPLARADDAVEIDSTHLRLDEVIDAVVRLLHERVGTP